MRLKIALFNRKNFATKYKNCLDLEQSRENMTTWGRRATTDHGHHLG